MTTPKRTVKQRAAGDAVPACSALDPAIAWFASRGWTPFEFQSRAWSAHLERLSGLIHAPTGLGKSYAAFFGPVLEYLGERRAGADATDDIAPRGRGKRDDAEPIRVVWITPMRALATDTVKTLERVTNDLSLPWTIEKRTGDTSGSVKLKQRTKLPTVLVTTPESLSVLLSYADSAKLLGTVRTIVVDEWHELLGSKRGVQTELAIARLRTFSPIATTWGLSATLGNLDEAMRVLIGNEKHHRPALVCIAGRAQKVINIESVLPEDTTRFPWAGHLGLPQVQRVVEAIERVSEQPSSFVSSRSTSLNANDQQSERDENAPEVVGIASKKKKTAGKGGVRRSENGECVGEPGERGERGGWGGAEG